MAERKLPRAVLGGTFDRLHAGHEALLHCAFNAAEEVGIGVTTDEFLRKSGALARKGAVRPFDQRRRELQAFLEGAFPGRSWYLIPLVDRWGAALDPSVRALVVSDETRSVGELANRLRRRKKIRPLQLLLCHDVMAEDLLRISSTRVRAMKIDRDGRRLAAIRVGLGSENPVKRSAVEAAFHQIFQDLPLTVEPVRIGTPNPQPWGIAEGVRGASRRAQLALGDRDYGVGVEATAVRISKKLPPLDLHAIAVVGADGSTEVALSAGYPLPPALRERMTGRTTLEEAVRQMGGPPLAGHTRGGAVGYLSSQQLTRETLIAEGIMSAFVGRMASRHGRVPRVEAL